MMDNNFQPNFASCSVESLLSIPTKFIFRETTSTGKYIFSKSEVSTLLRVSMLSSELDAILSLTYDALDRSQKCKAYRKYIEEANADPKRQAVGVSLRALLPILNVHSETAEDALRHATNQDFGVGRILNELQECANDLQKFYAMNYTMADQLEGYNSLSDEKRAIAEIEEAVVERIENLSALAGSSSNKDNENETSSNFTTMGDLCENLFPKQQQNGTKPTIKPDANREKQFSESQMFAAEALHIMQAGDTRDK